MFLRRVTPLIYSHKRDRVILAIMPEPSIAFLGRGGGLIGVFVRLTKHTGAAGAGSVKGGKFTPLCRGKK